MAEIDPQEFGEMRAQVGFLVAEIRLMRSEINEMKKTVDEAKGSWRVLAALGGLAATAGGGVGAYLMHLLGLPKGPLP